MWKTQPEPAYLNTKPNNETTAPKWNGYLSADSNSSIDDQLAVILDE